MLSYASRRQRISSSHLVETQESRKLICMSACSKQINKTWRIFPICFYMLLLSLLFLLCFVVGFFLKNKSREMSAVLQLLNISPQILHQKTPGSGTSLQQCDFYLRI